MANEPLSMSAILGMGRVPIRLTPTLADRFASAVAGLADSYDAADSTALMEAIGSARDAALLRSPRPTPISYSFPLSTAGAFPGVISIGAGESPVNETLLYLRPAMFTVSPRRLSVGALLDLAA